MADEDDIKEYRWETGYEKTWEAIQEDNEGEGSIHFAHFHDFMKSRITFQD